MSRYLIQSENEEQPYNQVLAYGFTTEEGARSEAEALEEECVVVPYPEEDNVDLYRIGGNEYARTVRGAIDKATDDDGDTLSVEVAQENAAEYAHYGNPHEDTLERLEEMTGEQRAEWWEAAQRVSDSQMGFKAMGLDEDFPERSINLVRDPEDWETLDPENITQVTCSISNKDLWEVEIDNSNYGDEDGVTYVDDSGHEHGGVFLSDEGEYHDINDDSDRFASDPAIGELDPNNNNSSSIVAFIPEEDEKIHVEAKGDIRRDMALAEGYNDPTPVSEYPEIESIIDAIIGGDSENDALEGWTPLAARSEDGGNVRGMQEKVGEIIDTHPGEYYLDSRIIACRINDGPASGKRYVAVPEENAEDVDELLFDPDLY